MATYSKNVNSHRVQFFLHRKRYHVTFPNKENALIFKKFIEKKLTAYHSFYQDDYEFAGQADHICRCKPGILVDDCVYHKRNPEHLFFRICLKCGLDKFLSDYHNRQGRKLGKSSTCKKCVILKFKKETEDLTDSYIRRLLAQDSSLKPGEFPQLLVNLKRNEIVARRLLKNHLTPDE